MKIKITNDIKIYNPPKWLIDELKKKYSSINPKWLDAKKMGRRTYGIPKVIPFHKISKNYISIPIGEIEEISSILLTENIPFSIYDNRIEENRNIIFKGKLKDFQSNAMLKILDYDNGTLEAPTGSGKTIMGLFAIAYRKQKTLVVVHTKDLAYQWIERACQFLDLKPFEIGILGDGHKQIGRRLTVGMIQTCSKMNLSKEFGMVIIDECHRSPSTVFLNTLSKSHARYKLGLSATLFRRDGLNKIIQWYCGPLRYSVDKNQLLNDGHILQPIFIIKYTNFYSTCDPIANYSGMLSELTNDSRRNAQIAKDIATYTQGNKVCAIALSDRKSHVFLLKDLLIKEGLSPLVLTGDTPKDERRRITDKIGNKNKILIATGQLIGEGFDCKNLNMLFMCSPIKFSGRVIQYIGRIMRPASGKERPIVFDYVDRKIPVLKRSFESRIKVYGEENIKYE